MYILHDDCHSVCAQSCPTLCNPHIDCSPLGSSVHGISQARILKWLAISQSGGSSQSRDQPSTLGSPILAGGFFNTPQPGKPEYQSKLVFIIAVVVPLLCHVQIFATPWTAAC